VFIAYPFFLSASRNVALSFTTNITPPPSWNFESFGSDQNQWPNQTPSKDFICRHIALSACPPIESMKFLDKRHHVFDLINRSISYYPVEDLATCFFSVQLDRYYGLFIAG